MSDKLKHQSDQNRRQFIINMGTVLGAFGVPWIRRMESMEKLSKNLFGNSMAFAQSSPNDPLCMLEIAIRAGYPGFTQLLMPQDADKNSIDPNRTIASNPMNNLRIKIDNSNSHPNLLINEHASSLAPFANHLFAIAERSRMGHGTRFISSHAPSTSDKAFKSFMVTAAKQNTREPVIKSPIVFGSYNNVSLASGSETSVSPIYVNSSEAFTNLFASPNFLPEKEASTQDKSFYRSIANIFINGFADILKSTLQESNQDASEFITGKNNALALFNNNIGEQLRTLSDQEKDDFGVNSIPKLNSMFRGAAFLHLPEFFALSIKAISLNAANFFTTTLFKGDYHGTDGRVNQAGIHQQESEYISQSWSKALTVLHEKSNEYRLNNDQAIKDMISMTITSEFFRGFLNKNSNFTDGGVNGIVGYSPLAKGGSYLDVSNDGKLKLYNPSSNSFELSDGEVGQSYYSLAALNNLQTDIPSSLSSWINFIKR